MAKNEERPCSSRALNPFFGADSRYPIHHQHKDKKLSFIELSFFTSKWKWNNFFFRFGVVRGLGKMVKDCYVIALPKEKEIHPVMLPLDGPGLDADR